ncbi:MAG TPA: AAA family ATPase [Anaerolineales bacterium]|nr:AAA family ATPase [Anaerolineales bacterium]
MSSDFSPAEFGAAWQKFIEYVNAQVPPPESPTPPLADKLTAFMGADPTSMTILKETFLERDLPNLQLAFNHFLTGPERSAELIGYSVEHDHPNFGLSMILSMRRWQVVSEGPVQYRSVELADGERLQCVQKGLFLIHDHGRRAVAFIRGGDQYWGTQNVIVEILCPEADRAEAILSEIRRLAHEHNVYRGQVISLGASGPDDVRFHALPPIEREAIILPPRLLETIERNTLGFAEHAPRLRAAGRHIKRGLLFHGPPGTGKTLTIMFLISQMRGRTAILLTGRILGLITQSCQLARLLAPSVVVLEDVDLVARERDEEHTGPLLFELLNEMDGLAADTDVLFVLSTNRPDLLETALVARPGRIDQAIEIPLPDADCRRRLLTLYGQGLNLQTEDIEAMVRRTEGVSAAFIRELLRKAALIAADQSRGESGPLVVTDARLREALHAIVVEGGELTKRLLGVAPEALESE